MNLTHCVVHELVKEAGQTSAEVRYSTRLLPLDDGLTGLVEKLNRSFGGSRLRNARFDDGPGKLFPQKFADYQGSDMRDADFLAYSREVLGHLETVIQGKSGAKGGYLLLADFDDAEGQRHAVFLIRNTVGRIFRRTDEGFDVEPVVHLDTDQLAMACRVDVGRYRRRQATYLELTHRSEAEVSAYFSDWIGAEETASAREMTTSLHDLLASVEAPVDAGSGEAMGQAATFERAYEHVRANPSKVVDIEELSQELYGSPAVLAKAARDHGIELEPEFRYDAGALREMVTMRVKADDIDLRFPRAALEDGLIYTEGEGHEARIVIQSAALVGKLLGS